MPNLTNLQPAPEGVEVYDYTPPVGVSDTFFVYVFDAGSSGVVSGATYNLLGILVTDGDFICRAWNGAYSLLQQTAPLGQIQIYDSQLRQWFDLPTPCFTLNDSQQCTGVLPEREYKDSGNIRFDLINTLVRSV